MTLDEFAIPSELLDGGWPGEFTPSDERTYFALLGDFNVDDVIAALRALRGQRFRPAVSDIVRALSPELAAAPTFDEALRLLYGHGGILEVRVRGTIDTNPSYRSEVAAAVSARLTATHPLLASFVRAIGLTRLLAIDLADPDEGKWRRRELREAWDTHVSTFDERTVVATALNGGDRRALGHLDPLAALEGLGPKQIGAGS